jgi:hypothetical protein
VGKVVLIAIFKLGPIMRARMSCIFLAGRRKDPIAHSIIISSRKLNSIRINANIWRII